MGYESLAPEIAAFNRNLGLEEASTPPSAWYTRPEFFDLEKEAVFRRNWLVAGNEVHLREPGAYVAGEVAGERYLLSRGEDGELRAFVNLCRHRATAVAEGCGKAESFTCPYHGWRYALDGELKSAPELGGVKGFDPSTSGLLPLSSAVWGPLVFVATEDCDRHLEEDLRPLLDLLEATGSARLKYAARKVYEISCNWKVFIDNYLDGGYHVPTLHKGLASELDMSSYKTEVFDRLSIQSSEGAGGRIHDRALYAFIYPNLMINRYGDVMDTNWVVPTGPTTCRVVIDFFFESTEGEEARKRNDACMSTTHKVQLEDVAISESVQQGLASRYFDRGRYSVRRQMAEHHFHRLLAGDFDSYLARPVVSA